MRLGRVVPVLALVCACRWEASEFFCRPDVDERVAGSLRLAAPAAPVVNPDSFSFAVFGDPQVNAGLMHRLGEFADSARVQGLSFFCVLGDLTDDCTEPERATVVAALRAVGVPCYVTIGNHDLYRRDGWDWFVTTWGPSVYALDVAGRVKLVFLDTADGRLGAAQLDWLAAELAERSCRWVVVLSHVPIVDGPVPIMWRLASAEERYRLLALLLGGGVRAYCAGHIHGWRVERVGGLEHFTVGTMPPRLADFDYGGPGYVVFSVVGESLFWRRVEMAARDGGF